MLLTEQTVRDNIRNQDGKRVFFLRNTDQLTSAARDYLTAERVEILPAEQAKIPVYRLLNGATLEEKPEQMTHLRGDILVDKTHPVIGFRGAVDTLESGLLLTQLEADAQLRKDLGEILQLARNLIRCDVMEEPLKTHVLCGLTEEEQRKRSHFPQDYYGQPHFSPSFEDGKVILMLNWCRCLVRQAERAAAEAFRDREGLVTRPDILQALNRMSSMVWILMIREKARGDR